VLTRYWFEFIRGGQATALSLGCGITAHNLDDARRMLRQEIFPLYGDRTVARVIEGVEVASLDETGVRRRLGNPAVRGVWFPMTPVHELPRLGKAAREQPRRPISDQW
jgi:hypothetical protein